MKELTPEEQFFRAMLTGYKRNMESCLKKSAWLERWAMTMCDLADLAEIELEAHKWARYSRIANKWLADSELFYDEGNLYKELLETPDHVKYMQEHGLEIK